MLGKPGSPFNINRAPGRKPDGLRKSRAVIGVRRDVHPEGAVGRASLHMRREKSGVRTGCARCAADLGPVRGNYKDACVRRESDVGTANPNIGDYRRYIDDRPVFRQFFCPGCGALIENEVAREDDPVLHDIELHLK